MQAVPPHTQQRWHNLPAPQTSFIGCESAIATIHALLQQTRLLTLTGSGGSGKTRLALAAAQVIGDAYPDGVAWVELAPLADPTLVPQTVADALHLREQPQHSYTELLTEHLLDRRMLLILDNCEHLRAACAELLTTLLQSGTLTQVLATSREPLAIEGERVWLAPMLSVPTLQGNYALATGVAELLRAEAVQLFEERAQAIVPRFRVNAQNAEAVAQICRRLDGMPLAIELAAARVNILVPQQIAERLDNSVHLLTRGATTHQSRHQTLRAALDWSYDLLPANEQAFFTRLAIFAGTFGVDAVEGICAGEGLERAELLDLLANLVEKSLVVAGAQETESYQEMRYRLLVPVRHYAAEQLRAAGTETLWRARHAAWYFELAKAAAPELQGAAQAYWLDRLESEHDNLRAALAWYAASDHGAPGDDRGGTGNNIRSQPGGSQLAGLQLSSNIGLFWCIRCYLSEGQQWIERFLRGYDPDRDLQTQVNAINILARISTLQSNFQAARLYYERSLNLAQTLEYDEGVETALVGLGVTHWDLGDFPKARAMLEEAVHFARAVQHLNALARALNNLGLVCMHQGDDTATRNALNECLLINQQLGNKTGIATVLFNLALLAKHDGDFVRAHLLYEESLAIDRELGNRSTMADALNNMGGLAIAQGDLVAAATYYDEAAQIYREVGAIGDTAYTSAGLGDIAFHNKEYGKARAHYTEALALFREASNPRLISRVLGQLGRIACREGDLLTAATLCSEALVMRRNIGHKPGMIFILDQGFLELALATSQPLIGARILGAMATARKVTARQRDPMEQRELEPYQTRIQALLGEAAFAAAWREGEAMSLDAVTAYVLDTLSAATVVQARPELRIFALGQSRVYRGDHLIGSSEWTYAKARELLFYLLCRPNSTREQIGLDFWPDASTEQVRKRLSAALAHARNALGREQEWILLTDGRYRLDPTRTYWFDVEVFEAKLHNAHQLLQNGEPRAEIITLLTEAISLYQGDFAEEFLEGEWHQSRRAALSRAYLEALLTLGNLHFEAERYAQAITAYQQALGKDPYLEEAHHELIRCYARSNKRSHALRQYETLTAALVELGATPSPETQVLIERLRHGENL